MNERKEIVLNAIINEHIKSGIPVGSGVIANKYRLNISSATIRNVMADLEEDGYIMQPHTSAGRVPTEKGYRFYIEKIETNKNVLGKNADLLNSLLDDKNVDFRKVAKMLAEFSGNAVFWAIHKNNLFYTGISNLFHQPEFAQIDLIQNVSLVIDRFDEIIDDIFERLNYGNNILLGEENPFGAFCGTIISKYKIGNSTGVFGVLGPIRMDYSQNLTYIKLISDKINTV